MDPSSLSKDSDTGLEPNLSLIKKPKSGKEFSFLGSFQIEGDKDPEAQDTLAAAEKFRADIPPRMPRLSSKVLREDENLLDNISDTAGLFNDVVEMEIDF